MKTIKVQASTDAFKSAKAGDIFNLFIHGCAYPPELRAKPPRVRLLEDALVGGHTDCELLDTWLDAPEYWPPWSAPGAPPPAPTVDAPTPQPQPPKPPQPPRRPPRHTRTAPESKPAANQGRKTA
jgi:hypothetical protein